MKKISKKEQKRLSKLMVVKARVEICFSTDCPYCQETIRVVAAGKPIENECSYCFTTFIVDGIL